MQTARELVSAVSKLRDGGADVEFYTGIDAPDSVDGFSIKHNGRELSMIWHKGAVCGRDGLDSECLEVWDGVTGHSIKGIRIAKAWRRIRYLLRDRRDTQPSFRQLIDQHIPAEAVPFARLAYEGDLADEDEYLDDILVWAEEEALAVEGEFLSITEWSTTDDYGRQAAFTVGGVPHQIYWSDKVIAEEGSHERVGS